ncbi:phage holin family protein [Intrasporangium sp. DVR]|uniref:phage holin family protein n=1 Tax=Intrasporangium sp. DVR TaxID=3127867 RepID=UPI00313A63CB
MSTDPRQERTLGQLVASATQDMSTLVRGEIALAKAEVSGQLKKAGKGGGLLAGAAIIGFYSVYFIFTTLVEVLDIWLPRWAAYLIITVLMLLIAGILAMVGIRKMKTVEPTPKKAVAEAQQTVAALKAATANPGSMAPGPRPEWDRPVTATLPAATPAARDGSLDTTRNT